MARACSSCAPFFIPFLARPFRLLPVCVVFPCAPLPFLCPPSPGTACPPPNPLGRYVLPTPTGDTGIVRTLDVPVYLTECNDTTLHCLDRDGKTMSIMIDNSGMASSCPLPSVPTPLCIIRCFACDVFSITIAT